MKAIDLEPADRDPKAIWWTAIVLSLIMLVGGVLIVGAYLRKTANDRVEEEAGREGVLFRLTSNFNAVGQDGEVRNLFELEGKVWVVAPIAPSQPAENAEVLAYMSELASIYKDNKDFHLVCLSVEDPEVVGHEELAVLAESQGANIDQWWFLTAGSDKMKGYLKDNLKLSIVLEREGGLAEELGKIDVPCMIRLVDRNRQLRGNLNDYDFDAARNIEERARKEIEEKPELAELPEAKISLGMREALKERMFKVISYTLTEEDQEGDKDPNYFMAVLVVLSIVLFIVIQGIRLRRRSNG